MSFKKILAFVLVFACIFTALASCGPAQEDETSPTDTQTEEVTQSDTSNSTDISALDTDEEQIVNPDIELENLGIDLEDAGINNGKFDGETTNTDFTVTYISGTENAYKYDDSTKTLTFSSLSTHSVYSISGKFNGNIVIDIGDDYVLELELAGLSLRSSSANPILINNGKEVLISAKKDTKNYIYDERTSINDTDGKAFGGSIHSKAALTFGGMGELFVQSLNNNGIQTETDLYVSDLALVVECKDKALNGKNSVTLKNCSTLLVAKSGDAIKTEVTDLSKDINQQNGTVSILGGTHNIFASNDGIEAAYDVIVDYGSFADEVTKETKTVDTILNIYTDSYSPYTDSTAHEKPELETRPLYVCYTSDGYKYSVKLSTADGSKSEWVDPTFHESIKSGRRTYYTYKFYVKPIYTKMQVFLYSKDQALQNEETYASKSEVVTIDTNSDTYRYSNRRWEWKNYSSLTGGSSANSSANPNAVSYSAKGIRGTNSITVKAGTINISAVDNAIGTNNQVILDSGKTPTGDITVNGGDITVKTKCNGLNSNGAIVINGGAIKILEAFEGIKGNVIKVTDGDISVTSINDGFSATAKTGTGITIDGGLIYVYSGAYGINASSSASYAAILFNGGNVVIIAPEAGKSAIYSDGGYNYKDGSILAILNKEGKRDSTTHYYSFSHVGKIQDLDLVENTYASVEIDGDIIVSAKIPKTFSATVVFIGGKTVQISSYENIDVTTNSNGVYWL